MAREVVFITPRLITCFFAPRVDHDKWNQIDWLQSMHATRTDYLECLMHNPPCLSGMRVGAYEILRITRYYQL